VALKLEEIKGERKIATDGTAQIAEFGCQATRPRNELKEKSPSRRGRLSELIPRGEPRRRLDEEKGGSQAAAELIRGTRNSGTLKSRGGKR